MDVARMLAFFLLHCMHGQLNKFLTNRVDKKASVNWSNCHPLFPVVNNSSSMVELSQFSTLAFALYQL
jgi:hypothetical protein